MHTKTILFLCAVAMLSVSALSNLLSAETPADLSAEPSAQQVRFATYNVSLFGQQAGEVLTRLRGGDDPQARLLARVIQTTRPDVLLLNEIDYDNQGLLLNSFADDYLAVDQHGTLAVEYPYRYAIPSNTGEPSGLDLNLDGEDSQPIDAWGYGAYPGQYAMAILSRFPIDTSAVRSFQKFRWSEMPGALRPVNPTNNQSYYSDDVWSQLRLSSKNHVDVPIQIGKHQVHLLASHPTPPVFDGAEDRNGCRNHDEVRFWVDYCGDGAADYFVDDAGKAGGLPKEALFVIAGDLNSDAVSGGGRPAAISKLLASERLTDPQPRHVLPAKVGVLPQGAKAIANPATRLMTTAVFGGKDGLRVDYVLPSRQMRVIQAGVFWPGPDDIRRLMITASDHRLVWVDVAPPIQ